VTARPPVKAGGQIHLLTPPEGYAWSLPLLYLVWAVAIVVLYFPCRWFASLKGRRRDWWLSYL
jgi:hypothetical protein